MSRHCEAYSASEIESGRSEIAALLKKHPHLNGLYGFPDRDPNLLRRRTERERQAYREEGLRRAVETDFVGQFLAAKGWLPRFPTVRGMPPRDSHSYGWLKEFFERDTGYYAASGTLILAALSLGISVVRDPKMLSCGARIGIRVPSPRDIGA